jgi:hypothetical protein
MALTYGTSGLLTHIPMWASSGEQPNPGAGSPVHSPPSAKQPPAATYDRPIRIALFPSPALYPPPLLVGPLVQPPPSRITGKGVVPS